MSKKNKNDSFSFENDPGKLSEEDDIDFTFTDIPVLGTDKKKDLFSFDDLPETQPDPSLASFEALLTEQPKTDGEDGEGGSEDLSAFDATASTMDVQKIMKSRGAKRKKKIIIIASSVALLLCVILGVIIVMFVMSPTQEEEKEKVLTPAEKAAIAKKKQQDRIAGMLKSADSQLKANEAKKALASFKNILKMDSRNFDAYTGIGRCYENLKETKQAEDNYTKAINLKSKKATPYILLAKILIKSDKKPQALELLKKVQDKFKENSKIALLLGSIYYDNGDSEHALEAYRVIKNRKEFSEETIRKFGKLLEDDSRKDAEELYMYAGKKFKSSSFFISAANSAESSSEKIKVLTKALKILPESDKDIDELKFILSQAYINDGNKSEASVTLQSINLKKLDKKQCEQLIPLATASGIADIEGYCLKLLESNPKEVALQEAILKELAKTQPPEKLLDIYSSWWTSHTNEPVANYLYAKALGDSITAKKYFETAIALNPQFYEAILELAKIDIKINNTSAAVKNLQKAINLNNKKITPHKLLAIAYVKQEKEAKAIEEYSKFLDSQGYKESKKALLLLEIALLMKTAEAANKCLAQIKKDSSMLQEYKENNAKKKLIFGGASDSDFKGTKTGLLRKYYILYLLSKGRVATLMKLRTSKKEFPEFWKIYLMRKKHMTTWKSLAKLYYEKNSTTADPAILLLVSMWLENKTIEDVEKQINRIPQEKRGILYALIAEEYARQRKITKASIRFKKAKRAPKSIYNGVINYILHKQR